MEAGETPAAGSVSDLLALLDEVASSRPPVDIDRRRLSIGAIVVEAYSGHIDDMLVAFIELIRLVRSGPPPARMAFRRADIEALAARLDCAGEVVVDHLAALVGADDGHLEAMNHLFETGAIVIDSGLNDIDLDANPAAMLRR